MFGAVFFVAIGMLVDFRLLLGAWPLVLGVTAFALFLRPIATGLALVVAGNETRDSVRARFVIGASREFSFIIAQLGSCGWRGAGEFLPDCGRGLSADYPGSAFTHEAFGSDQWVGGSASSIDCSASGSRFIIPGWTG